MKNINIFPTATILSLIVLVFSLSSCADNNDGYYFRTTDRFPTSQYRVFDLTTFTMTEPNSIPDLATNPIYKTTHIAFTAIPGTEQVDLGAASSTIGAQSDETPTVGRLDYYYISVFEITQSQWQLAAGTTPWTTLTPTSLIGDTSTSAQKPAYGLSHTDINTMLSNGTFANISGTASLPSNSQWEYASRGNSQQLFSWGNSLATTEVTQHALVRETRSTLGPIDVGTKAANSFGLYDMHGNVWEWTEEGNLRGGSWSDNLILARSANKLSSLASSSHALNGFRLVINP